MAYIDNPMVRRVVVGYEAAKIGGTFVAGTAGMATGFFVAGFTKQLMTHAGLHHPALAVIIPIAGVCVSLRGYGTVRDVVEHLEIHRPSIRGETEEKEAARLAVRHAARVILTGLALAGLVAAVLICGAMTYTFLMMFQGHFGPREEPWAAVLVAVMFAYFTGWALYVLVRWLRAPHLWPR